MIYLAILEMVFDKRVLENCANAIFTQIYLGKLLFNLRYLTWLSKSTVFPFPSN